MTKAVTKKEDNAVTTFDYGKDVGAGFEDQTSEDYSIPFLAVLQSISPQVENNSPEGSKAGMIFNTVTNDLYGELLFVPSKTQHVFVEWVPREKGGGIVAVHEKDSEVVKKAKESASEFGKYKTEKGNDLVQTFYVYGVICDEKEAISMAVIAFTSSKIRVYKHWNTKLKMFTMKTKDGRKIVPPMYAHLTTIKAKKESNPKGTFYNFELAPANGDVASSLLPPEDPRLIAGRQCKEMIDDGKARAAYESQDAAADTAADQGDEIPF